MSKTKSYYISVTAASNQHDVGYESEYQYLDRMYKQYHQKTKPKKSGAEFKAKLESTRRAYDPQDFA